MMRRAAISLLTWMACIGAAGAGFAEEPLVRHVDDLRCGRVTARLRTNCIEQLSTGWECVSQSLRLIQRYGVTKDVPLDIRRVPSSVAPERNMLDGDVTSWACVRSRSGQHYVFLAYSCQSLGDAYGTLSPSGEWGQVIDQAGHVVSGRRNGDDLRVEERLGLEKVLDDIHVTGVGPYK